MSKVIFLSLFFAISGWAAPQPTDLKFGSVGLHFPHSVFFTPMPSLGAMHGESERSTVLVIVKSTGIPRYSLASAQKIWSQSLENSGLKDKKESCVVKSRLILCQQKESQRRLTMIFGAKQVVTLDQKGKGQELSSQDDIQISERR